MTKQPPNRRSPDDLANLITAGQQNSAATTTEERHFGIRIARDGKWHYLGTPINRPALPKLFATVLKKDDGGAFWLETPVEKGRIDVDDAPFVAIELTVEGKGRDTCLRFRTNLDDEFTAGPDHPIRVEIDPETEEPSPYILVRDNLEALIARPVFYELAELAEEVGDEDDLELQVWSEGIMFRLGSAAPGD